MKNIIRTAILFVIVSIGGCNPCKNVKPYLSIENMDLTLRKITGKYSGGFYSKEFNADTLIAYDSLMLKLLPTGSYFFASNTTYDFSNLFVSSAYAMKCAPDGYKGTKEQISDIIILSDSLFLSSGTIGDTLSKFFVVSGLVGEEKVSPVDLLTFTATDKPTAMTELWLTLKQNPTGSKKHKFTIIYKQTNGKEFKLVTPEIEFE